MGERTEGKANDCSRFGHRRPQGLATAHLGGPILMISDYSFTMLLGLIRKVCF